MEFQELQKIIQKTFNTVADGYDKPALRYFPDSAILLCNYLAPQAGEQILDVATGTGNVALAMASTQAHAKITGIDFSDAMLATAKNKAKQANLKNVSFKHKEMTQLDLPANYFDAASCGFGIFFLEDMQQGMRAIRHTLCNEGRLVVSSFYQGSFSPLIEIFAQDIERYGVTPPKQLWLRLSTEELMEDLFKSSGFGQVNTYVEDLSYNVESEQQWWDILWNAGYRGLLNQLSSEQLEQFKSEHLHNIRQHMNDQGLHIHVQTLFGVGEKQ